MVDKTILDVLELFIIITYGNSTVANKETKEK